MRVRSAHRVLAIARAAALASVATFAAARARAETKPTATIPANAARPANETIPANAPIPHATHENGTKADAARDRSNAEYTQNEEAAESTSPRSGHVVPALSWIALQLIPSPELVSAHGNAHFGARWQVTPFLYSFGVHRGEPRLRSFLIEPILRHSGSLELFVSPEYLAITNRGADRWFMRPGLRAYFPLLERGDYLSCSIGTSYAIAPTPNASGVGYEVGVYSFFGVLGAQLTYSPARLPVDWIATLSFRYF